MEVVAGVVRSAEVAEMVVAQAAVEVTIAYRLAEWPPPPIDSGVLYYVGSDRADSGVRTAAASMC